MENSEEIQKKAWKKVPLGVLKPKQQQHGVNEQQKKPGHIGGGASLISDGA